MNKSPIDTVEPSPVAVHFSYMALVPPTDNSEDPPTTQERVACEPGATVLHQTTGRYHKHYQRTNDVRAVTCTKCMETELFKKVVAINRSTATVPVQSKSNG